MPQTCESLATTDAARRFSAFETIIGGHGTSPHHPANRSMSVGDISSKAGPHARVRLAPAAGLVVYNSPSRMSAHSSTGNGPSARSTLLYRWAVVLLVPAALMLIQVPAGVTAPGWRLFAIFVGTILGLILQPLPLGAMALIGVAAASMSGALPPGQALSGYADPLVWMVLAAFCISRGMIKTGLGRRIALWFIRAIGHSSIGLGYSVVASRHAARDGRAVQRRPRRRHHLPDRQEPRGSVRVHARADGGPSWRVPDADGLSLRHDGVGDVLHRQRGQPADRLAGETGDGHRAELHAMGRRRDCAGAGVDGRGADGALAGARAVGQADAGRGGVRLGRARPARSADVARTNHARRVWCHDDPLCDQGVARHRLPGDGARRTGRAPPHARADVGRRARRAKRVGHLRLVRGDLRDGQGPRRGGPQRRVRAIGGRRDLRPELVVVVPVLLAIYLYAHYAFATITAHVSALYVPFAIVMLAAGTPPILTVLTMAYVSSLGASLTHYGTTSSPIYYGAGYLSQGAWWRVGLMVATVNAVVWVACGLAWWKVLGWW